MNIQVFIKKLFQLIFSHFAMFFAKNSNFMAHLTTEC